jgi:hypothetical protein
MDVVQFHGKTYGKENSHLYVFEPTWDSFRPISNIGWDGKKFAVDHLFKENLFSPYYGFESQEQKDKCRKLADVTELAGREITDPIEMWKWAGINASWFRDRPCVFLNECASRNWQDYLKYLGSRPKTLRRHYSNRRITRRLVAK